MKTKNYTSTVNSAYGNPLPKPLPLKFSVELFESKAEVEAANELPDDDGIVQYANAKRTAAARAKATNAALSEAGIEPPAKDDPKVLTRDFIRTLTTAGKTEEEAIELARMALGDKFAQ